MARPIYAINQTAGTISINDLSGLRIPAYDTVDLRLFFSLDELDHSEDLQTAISNGWIVLNDGADDLTLEQSQDLSTMPTFYDVPTAFLDLTDTPATYSGYGSYISTVKSPEDGLEFTNTLSGINAVYPIENDHIANKKYVDDMATGYMYAGEYISWSHDPTFDGILYLLGWYIKTNDNVILNSTTPVTALERGFHSHFVLDISTIYGSTPFTITASGLCVDEATGNYFGFGEDITVTGTSYYQTASSFIDEPIFSIVESGKSCTMDIYKVTYFDYGNRDFILYGSRLEWQPDTTAWDYDLKIYKINNNGSRELIDSAVFHYQDAVLRADKDLLAKYKKGNYNTIIKGSENEGLVIEMYQKGISTLSLYLNYSKYIDL